MRNILRDKIRHDTIRYDEMGFNAEVEMLRIKAPKTPEVHRNWGSALAHMCRFSRFSRFRTRDHDRYHHPSCACIPPTFDRYKRDMSS